MKLVIIIFVMTRINEGLPAKQTKMSLKKSNNNPNRKFNIIIYGQFIVDICKQE